MTPKGRVVSPCQGSVRFMGSTKTLASVHHGQERKSHHGKDEKKDVMNTKAFEVHRKVLEVVLGVKIMSSCP